MGVNESLNLRVGVPLLAVHFVTADVKIGVGEQLRHFRDELLKELIRLLLRGVHGRIENPDSPLDLVRSGRTRQLGITDEPSRRMPRHIEFRDDANAAIMGISDDVAYLVLRVELAVRSHSRQFGESLALDPEALI